MKIILDKKKILEEAVIAKFNMDGSITKIDKPKPIKSTPVFGSDRVQKNKEDIAKAIAKQNN